MEKEATGAPRARQNWFWPDVSVAEGARLAFRLAFWCAIFSGAVIALLSLLVIANPDLGDATNASPWWLIEAALWVLIAVGLWKSSPTAAWAALGLHVLEAIWGVANGTITTLWALAVSAVLILAFVNAARASVSLNRMAKMAREKPSP